MVSRPYKSVTLDPHCELRAHMLLLSACVPCTTDRVRSGPGLGGSSACRSDSGTVERIGAPFPALCKKCRQTPINRTNSPPRHFYSPHSALRGRARRAGGARLALEALGAARVPRSRCLGC